MVSFRHTAAWVGGTAVLLYVVMTVLGVRFMLSHENAIADDQKLFVADA